MRKIIPIDLDQYSENEWIDLPQGTRIHPKEIEKMFDEQEMDIGGREYAASISSGGNIEDEAYGSRSEVHLTKPRHVSDAKESIFTHSHPRFILQQELDEGQVISPSFSDYDLENPDREIRVFSQDFDKSSGQIHSFKNIDEGSDEEILERKKMGKYFIADLKELAEKHRETPKYQQSMQTVKGFPYSTNMYTASEFNLARRGAGDASIINVRKSSDPNKLYVTKIRSTHKEEPQYDVLQTLPRKKKQTKSLVNRKISINIPKFKTIKLNLGGLNNMLIKPKTKSIKKSKKK